MTRQQRLDALYSILYQYIAEQHENQIWQRESSSAYLFAKGKLVGFCTAYGYEIDEDSSTVTIRTHNNRTIMSMEKDNA